MPASQEETAKWARARELFDEAAPLEPDARRAFLDSACSNDPPLRALVEELLEEHDRARGPLDTRPGFLLTPDTESDSGIVVANRFEIRRRIDGGGMGVVYEALDRDLGAPVALKRIRPELVFDPKIRERFRGEILIGRKVAHPNVCKIYDLVRFDDSETGRLAFTMELLAGETLAQRLGRDGALPVEQAMSIARQMAAGLAALHAEKIVHRDFKPANVMLAETGDGEPRVKIMDFGLARSELAAERSLSGPHDLVGTPVYMAPEQLEGRRELVGPVTDVYALGLVLYETIAGVRPFSAETVAENTYQKRHERPTPLDERVPGLPETWNATILRCLAPEPQDRPQTPEQVIEALEGRTELEPHPAPPPPDPGSPSSWPRRLLWASAIPALAIFLALFSPGSRSSEVDDLLHWIGWTEPTRVVAILPFDVLESDSDLSALADGLMTTITRGLTQFEGVNDQLVVMSPTMVLNRGAADPAAAWEKLGAGYAVEGTLQGSGDRLELMLTLSDAKDGPQLDTEVVTGSRGDVLGLRNDAVRVLANMLDLRIQPEHVESPLGISNLSLGAGEFYTAGVGYLNRSFDTDNLHRAIDQFERALDRDNQYAPAHAGLAESYRRLYIREKDEQRLEQARLSAQDALRLDDRLPEAHITLGSILTAAHKPNRAIERFQRALELNPRNGEAFEGLAQAYDELGRFDEALATHHQAVQLRNSDWRAHHQLGAFFFKHRMYGQAVESFRRVTRLTTENAQGYVNLGAALQKLGSLVEAQRAYETAIRIEPRPKALANLGKIRYDAGEYERASELFLQAVDAEPNNFRSRANLASAYEMLGDARARPEYLRAAGIVEGSLGTSSEPADSHSRLAFYFTGAGDIASGERWLSKALLHESNSSMEVARNAATLARLGQWERACDLATRAHWMGHTLEELTEFSWLEPMLAEQKCEALKKTDESGSEIGFGRLSNERTGG